MALTLVAVVVYWLNIHGPLWIDYAALIAIGFLIYGPIMIIGLHALDLVPKKAAGTAAGFTGFFGYVFGSAIAGTGVGWIADHWGWNGVFVTMVACCAADDRLRRHDARPQDEEWGTVKQGSGIGVAGSGQPAACGESRGIPRGAERRLTHCQLTAASCQLTSA